METYRKPNEQLFSQYMATQFPKHNKNIKTYIRSQQHKHLKHQDIKTY